MNTNAVAGVPAGEARPRRLFMLLSPRALSYAGYALRSLSRNALERLQIHLITDAYEDKQILSEEISARLSSEQIILSTFSKGDLAEREQAMFSRYPNLRAFRNGHPCWRKITDPLLLTEPGEEMILLDPDLYFPNRFTFEPTLERRLLLMWQKPNCLLPPGVVRAAFEANVPLANHVDIGVAHWRAPIDLDWLEWLIGRLGGQSLPHFMHIEAIVWAALAMRMAGGYLSPRHWSCWRRSQWKRVALKARIPGAALLRAERFAEIKCFHAGGEAKSWLPEAAARGWMDGKQQIKDAGKVLPFVELTVNAYRREQTAKNVLRLLGYYRIFQSA